MIFRRAGFAIFAVLVASSSVSLADFALNPRYEYISGDGQELANRLILKSKLSVNRKYFGLFVDGFAEFDENKTEYEFRRSPHRGYVQEAYLEFKRNSFYVRVGRQALRWSEMWVVPSLDIWTARRWNRMYLDPLSEQLVHPTGLSFTYAKQDFSVDLVGITNLAESSYPLPVPPPAPQSSEANFGARVQLDVKGFHFSALGAKQEKKYLYGAGANYAFDSAVPKIELGARHDTSVTPLYGRAEESFAAAGVDVFLGNWILTPQVTVFDYGDLRQKSGDPMQIYYASAQWKVEPHDFQAMGFTNPVNKDYFWSLGYSYNLNKYLTAGGFVQEYYGENATLHWLYRQITGEGLVAGIRLELNSDWAF